MRVRLAGAPTTIALAFAREPAIEADATVVAFPSAVADVLAAGAVRKLVFASSAGYYGCEPDDPAFFTEAMRPRHSPRTRAETALVEADDAVQAFAAGHPGVTVTTLRFCATTESPLLGLPVVPGILGFDPRVQFIHPDDVAGALRYAVLNDLPGVYNAAPDGVLALSEAASLLGKPFVPLLPPWGTSLAGAVLRIPAETRRELRFGRGLDNRKLKQAGYRFRLTTRESLQASVRGELPGRSLGGASES